MSIESKEFYIGYIPQAPADLARVIRRTVVVLGITLCIVAVIIVLFQRKFSNSNFEYGTFTTLDGQLYSSPVPHLKITVGTDNLEEQIFQNVLLVSPGKSGVSAMLQELKAEHQFTDGTHISLSGFLIYGDGKALLQIDHDNNRFNVLKAEVMLPAEDRIDVQQRSINGEVVDPKCYFGVMKPGEGKLHRACAIRCIAGGIPAVFHESTSGEYYIITGTGGKPINTEILSLVGDQLTIQGNITRWNDWKILELDTEMVRQLSASRKSNESIRAFQDGISLCMP